MTRDELESKLLANSAKVDGGCRRWTGAHTQKGYGHIFVGGGCRHRDCIEPSHLEAITHAENVRRAAELVTHCPKDHEYTPENTRWVAPAPGFVNRRRACRTCFNAARRAARATKRELSLEGGSANA